jgi:5-methylcytosine-specific restriction endonuclease McrBC GTP-binding regulatory subunit McrB
MSLKKLSEKSKEFNLPQENIDKRETGRLSFISKFPLNTIKDLSIDQYVQGTDENSFCYWLEFKKILFGIGGGNASKFGVYKAKDGNYYSSYGKNKKQLTGEELEDFFSNIKSGILQALEYTSNDQIDKIKTIDIPLWNMVLQKILSVYYPDKFITIGSPDVLIECARDIKIEGIELKPENSIQINYECKKALSTLPEFKEWSYEEIGTFIWETYLDDSKRDYYILGSKYGNNNDEDIFPEMLAREAIAIGFASNIDLEEYYFKNHSEITDYLKEKGEEPKSYNALKYFLTLKVGDRIAVKANGSPKGKKGFLSVIGIAEVIEKDGEIYRHDPNGLGHLINVKFIKAPVYKEFDLGGYGRTIHKLSKPDHIDLIFKNDYKILDMNSILKDHREEFTNWLTDKYGEDSGTSSSYIKAIDILSQILSKELFKTTDDNYLESLYKDLIKEQRNQEGKYYHSDAPSYGSNGFYSASIKSYRQFLKDINQTETIVKDDDMNFPLNTILYGPPGTGKTYNTILRAAQIIENRTIDSYGEALNIFKANLHNQIEFITFHQNYSYEDFIQGLRPETDNKSSLVFDKKDGVFKKIADKALENLKLVQKAPDELTSEAKFDKALELFSDKVLESEDNFKINNTAYIFEVEEDAFRYTGEKWTNHANGLRMKFSDLKEFYRNNVKSRKDIKGLSSISGLANQHATYYYLVYAEIIKYLPKKTIEPQKVTRKNFVIIIDEINRANISRVFGELITLIEPDKRSHGSIPLEARLPSGDPFIVPSNLFIIGTMNTADKSIALLDIALRRRFEFESMYPKYEIKDQEIYDVDILEKINKQIIKSKGHDFQIGHAYFMGENKDLVQRMNKKVIPLLLEYYMNDEKEVKGILNSAGLIIEENSWPLKISGKND